MMDKIFMGEYDVCVIGAGHAGCEAALAAARMGKRTLMLSMNLEAVAMMPCNPNLKSLYAPISPGISSPQGHPSRQYPHAVHGKESLRFSAATSSF